MPAPILLVFTAPTWQAYAAYMLHCFAVQTSFMLAMLTLRIALHQALALHTDKAARRSKGW